MSSLPVDVWMYVFTFLPLDALRNVRLCCRIFRRAAASALASWPRWNVKVIVPSLRNVGTQLGVASIGLKDPVGGNYWMMSLGVKMAYTKQSRSVGKHKGATFTLSLPTPFSPLHLIVHGGTPLCLPEDHFSLLVDRTCDGLVFLHQVKNSDVCFVFALNYSMLIGSHY